MSSPILDSLEATATAVSVFDRTAQIPAQQNVLWEILRGVVKTETWTETGKIISLGYWGAGDIVGQPLAAIAPYEISCVTPVMVRCLDPQQATVLPMMIQHIQRLQKLAWVIRQDSVAEQLWCLMIWLFEKFGTVIPEGYLIDIRLTHQELAELAGSSRVTITRLLKQLEGQGLLYRLNKYYVLQTLEPNLSKLLTPDLNKESKGRKILGCDKKS
jgi:CRP-like cAMP-binding protein